MAVDFLAGERFEKTCKDVFHSDAETQKVRFEELVNMHRATFNTDDVEFFSSPGRIEIRRKSHRSQRRKGALRVHKLRHGLQACQGARTA